MEEPIDQAQQAEQMREGGEYRSLANSLARARTFRPKPYVVTIRGMDCWTLQVHVVQVMRFRWCWLARLIHFSWTVVPPRIPFALLWAEYSEE